MLFPSVASISHALAKDYNHEQGASATAVAAANTIDDTNDYKAAKGSFSLNTSGRTAYMVPSLLSADFGSLASEARFPIQYLLYTSLFIRNVSHL